MSIQARKERDRQRMRREILDKAMELFVQKGFESVSMRAIAEGIEYSPAAIYRYFNSKDEILHALHEEGFQIFIRFLEKSANIDDPMKRLVQMGQDYLAFADEYPEYYELMFISNAPMKDHSNEWPSGDRAFSILHDVVRQAIDSGQLDFTDSVIGALSIWSMTHGIVSLKLRNRMKMVPEHLHQEVANGVLQFLNYFMAKS